MRLRHFQRRLSVQNPISLAAYYSRLRDLDKPPSLGRSSEGEDTLDCTDPNNKVQSNYRVKQSSRKPNRKQRPSKVQQDSTRSSIPDQKQQATYQDTKQLLRSKLSSTSSLVQNSCHLQSSSRKDLIQTSKQFVENSVSVSSSSSSSNEFLGLLYECMLYVRRCSTRTSQSMAQQLLHQLQQHISFGPKYSWLTPNTKPINPRAQQIPLNTNQQSQCHKSQIYQKNCVYNYSEDKCNFNSVSERSSQKSNKQVSSQLKPPNSLPDSSQMTSNISYFSQSNDTLKSLSHSLTKKKPDSSDDNPLATNTNQNLKEGLFPYAKTLIGHRLISNGYCLLASIMSLGHSIGTHKITTHILHKINENSIISNKQEFRHYKSILLLKQQSINQWKAIKRIECNPIIADELRRQKQFNKQLINANRKSKLQVSVSSHSHQSEPEQEKQQLQKYQSGSEQQQSCSQRAESVRIVSQDEARIDKANQYVYSYADILLQRQANQCLKDRPSLQRAIYQRRKQRRNVSEGGKKKNVLLTYLTPQDNERDTSGNYCVLLSSQTASQPHPQPCCLKQSPKIKVYETKDKNLIFTKLDVSFCI